MNRTERKIQKTKSQKAVVDEFFKGKGIKKTKDGMSFMASDGAAAGRVAFAKNAETYQSELAEIAVRVAEIDKELPKLRKAGVSHQKKVAVANAKIRKIYSVVAKKVGMDMKYMTPGGSISMAKVRKLKDDKAIKAIMNKFNKKYVPAVNTEMAKIRKTLKLTAKEQENAAKHDAMVRECNKLQKDAEAYLGVPSF